MRKWGLALLVIGISSLILPLLGLQLRIMNLFSGGKEVSLLLIGIGAVLYLVSDRGTAVLRRRRFLRRRHRSSRPGRK